MSVATVLMIGVGLGLSAGLARGARRAVVSTRTRALRPARSLLPPRLVNGVAVALARADVELSPDAALRWWALMIGAAAWFSMVLAPALLVPATVGAVVAGPVCLRLRSQHADRATRAALPRALDHVVAHLRAGGTVIQALRDGAARPGPLRADFVRMDARLNLGASLEHVLEQWVSERPVTGVRSTAGALCMVTTMGGSAATALEGVVRSLRDDDAALGEAKALSSQARVSAVVVGAAPLAYLVFASATDPASSRVLVATGPGMVCLMLGLGLEVLAAIWMRALVGAPR